MDALQILLIIFGLLNLAFAGSLYLHSTRQAVVTWYVLISFFASLWTLSTLLTGIDGLPFSYFVIALHGHYIFGFLAYLSFFWFAIFYPTTLRPAVPFAVLLSSAVLVFLAAIPFTNLIFTEITPGETLSRSITFNERGYIAFILFLSGVFFTGLLTLIYRFHRSEGEHHTFNSYQIYLAILSNLLAGTLGITFNLIFPLYGNFSLFYVNPIFVTVALTVIGFYNLIKYRLFNTRIVLAEFFTAGIWIVFFTRFVLSETANEGLINGILFLSALVFGFFLIQSVMREVKQREEIERLADDLKKANERLKELDKLKSEFVSIASHQLRSPLTSIKGYASLVLEGSYGAVPPSVQEAVQKIFDSSKLMALSVEDFLNVSRIEQGRMKYEMSPFDLAHLTQIVIDEMIPVVQGKGLVLRFSTDSEETYMIKADLGKIKQVLANLIDNAVKYTPAGSITVSLTRIKERSLVRIAVKDTGVGIPQHALPKLFERFVRAENANTVNISGTGLGLYVAKQMVEAHKGKIWAESGGEGKGSVFYVELPLA
jgi:signal transduction histidine kinase